MPGWARKSHKTTRVSESWRSCYLTLCWTFIVLVNTQPCPLCILLCFVSFLLFTQFHCQYNKYLAIVSETSHSLFSSFCNGSWPHFLYNFKQDLLNFLSSLEFLCWYKVYLRVFRSGNASILFQTAMFPNNNLVSSRRERSRGKKAAYWLVISGVSFILVLLWLGRAQTKFFLLTSEWCQKHARIF